VVEELQGNQSKCLSSLASPRLGARSFCLIKASSSNGKLTMESEIPADIPTRGILAWSLALLVCMQLCSGAESHARLVPLGDPFQVNTTTEGKQLRPQVVPVADGGFAILWSGPPGATATYGRRFDSSGTPVGSEFPLQQVSGPWAAVSSADSLLIGLLAPDGGVAVGNFRLDGTLQGLHRADVRRSLDTSLSIGAMPSGDVAVLTWGEGYSIHAQLFRIDGQPVGPSFVVDEIDIQPTAPRVAVGPDGSFVVVWMDDYWDTVGGRRFEVDGIPLGERIFIVQALEGGQPEPRVCTDGMSGNFVTAWTSRDANVEFRRFAADGHALTGRICANLEGIPSLSCRNDESFVLVGIVGYARRASVVARAFDRDGNVIGTAPILGGNNRTSHPAVATLADGSIIIAWVECDGSGCDGIFAQRFAVSATPDPLPCPGDCDGDGHVSIDELVTVVHLALNGRSPLLECPAIETGSDCTVSIGDLLTAVNSSLGGCNEI
jgi:hypothetical protein